jgi:D-aspartate ligase
MIPAIVLSSHTIGLAVIRSLGIMGVPVNVVYYDEHDMGYVSKYVKNRLHAPHPEKDEDRFINLLIDYSRKFDKSILFPVDDVTLKVVSRNKDILKKYYIVACTGWGITERYIDKKHTYALADSLGVPSPKTMVPKSVLEAESFGSSIGYPCLVKPCESHRYFEIFGKKMVRVDTPDQLLKAFGRASDAGLEVMIQEYIPGDDTMGVNYNSYFWQGEALAEFTAEKVRMAPPGFGVPRVVQSKEIREIIEPGRKILHGLGYYGYSCTEFKKDIRDGVYKFMEVNGRHNRSGLLSVCCGLNFPWIEYRHLVYGERPSSIGFREGVYWIDELRDIVCSITHYRDEHFKMSQYVGPYRSEHIYAIFDWKDPKPVIKRCIDLPGMVLREIRRHFGAGCKER